MGAEHEDYHRVTDSAEKIDYRNLEKIALTSRSRRQLRSPRIKNPEV